MQAAKRNHLFADLLTQPNLTFTFENQDGQAFPIGVIEPSPCTAACPAGVNVKAYVSLIAAGRFREALSVVRQRNPFPGICGRVCTHPCEASCQRGQLDVPVAIRALKRFVADYELKHLTEDLEPPARRLPHKIAIIGSGPAGLTAANDLQRAGYGVTIFEALPEPGGMFVAGIPAFRLPRTIIRHEIDIIKRLGVEIKTGTRISGARAIDSLFRSGYKAVFIAVGAHKGKKLQIPGETSYAGVIDAISFLQAVNFGPPPELGPNVVVIGGGNSAIDAARAAVRLGTERVTIIYRRSRNEMPATAEEIREAKDEGVQIHFLAAPRQITGEQGHVTGMVCQKMKLGAPDASGRRRPVPVDGKEFFVAADTIIAAVSQEPDLSFLPKNQRVEVSNRRRCVVDKTTLATSRSGVFAGGDAVTGPNTIIDAIAAGHLAAQSIQRYLQGEPLAQESSPAARELEFRRDLSRLEKTRRHEPSKLAPGARVDGFNEIELAFDEAQAIAEASRCLRCGPCHECTICVAECGKKVTILSCPPEPPEFLLRLPEAFGAGPGARSAAEGRIDTADNRSLPVRVTPLTCQVEEETCRGCGDCVAVCEYSAPALVARANGLYVSRIDESVCKGCGTCVAICPSSAIVQHHFTPEWFSDKLKTMDSEAANLVIFTCSWKNTTLNQDSRNQVAGLDGNVLLMQTACTGRIDDSLILQAFEHGAEGVLVYGCAPDHCHYGFGSRHAGEHFERVRMMLDMLGFSSQKFHWVTSERHGDADLLDAIRIFVSRLRHDVAPEQQV